MRLLRRPTIAQSTLIAVSLGALVLALPAAATGESPDQNDEAQPVMIEAPRFELPDRDAEMVSQTESYPGFAGVYREDGELVVALEGTAGLSTAAQEDLIGTLAEMSGADLAVENVAIRTGFTYTFAELHEWHRLLSDEFLALDGAAYTDLSESTNAVVLAGDEPASLAQSMEAAIREHAIPRSAVSFIEAEPEE